MVDAPYDCIPVIRYVLQHKKYAASTRLLFLKPPPFYKITFFEIVVTLYSAKFRDFEILGTLPRKPNAFRKRVREVINTLRTGSFKLFKRPLPGFLTILTL